MVCFRRLNFFVPPVFQLRGDGLNVADLIFGLGFDGWRNHHPVVIEASALPNVRRVP
jgi:hypothetical protein